MKTMTAKNEKINALQQTMVGVENELLRRKIERQEVTIDGALDVINQAAAIGAIEIENCAGCDDDYADDDSDE
jgi:hypothetical protein